MAIPNSALFLATGMLILLFIDVSATLREGTARPGFFPPAV
jgi:hypothetical protein